ncbi:MAG: MATE family efflux transporter [Eubacteriaceae bacterium]|jgi:putative MATE family efflux protein|nr:MATE family efflux transporter [Eubacteriaceae bacterium]
MKRASLLEGSVLGKLTLFALPLVASNLLQSVYTIADMALIGNVESRASVSAISIGGQITLLVTNAIIGFSSGAMTLVSQYYGAKKRDELQKTVGTLFFMYLAIAAFVGVLFTAISTPLLRMLSTPADAFDQARLYLGISMWGSVLVFGYNGISAVLRGMGDSKRPLLFVLAAASVSVALDYLLIVRLRMGVQGAIIATLTGQAVSVALSLEYLHRKRDELGFKLSLSMLRPDRRQLELLIRLGLPVCVQQVVVQISFLSVQALANSYGTAQSALFGIGNRINSFATMPGNAVSTAISSMAGQCIGSGLDKRAEATAYGGMLLNLAVGSVVTFLIALSPASVVRLFTPDSDVLELSQAFVRYMSASYIITPIIFCVTGLATGAGHTVFVLTVTLVCSLAVRVPLAYFFSQGLGMGFNGVGLAMGLASFGGIPQCAWFLAKKRWMRRVVKI